MNSALSKRVSLLLTVNSLLITLSDLTRKLLSFQHAMLVPRIPSLKQIASENLHVEKKYNERSIERRLNSHRVERRVTRRNTFRDLSREPISLSCLFRWGNSFIRRKPITLSEDQYDTRMNLSIRSRFDPQNVSCAQLRTLRIGEQSPHRRKAEISKRNRQHRIAPLFGRRSRPQLQRRAIAIAGITKGRRHSVVLFFLFNVRTKVHRDRGKIQLRGIFVPILRGDVRLNDSRRRRHHFRSCYSR